MNVLSSRLTMAVACVIVATPLGAQYPTEPPPAMPMRQLQLPPFQEFQLPNGLGVVLVPDHDLPAVIISLSMPGGSANDPVGKEGLSDIVSDLLTKGTARRTAEQIAEEIEGVGAALNAGAGRDFFTLGTAVLKQDVDLAFDLMGDVITNATLPAEEFALTQQRLVSSARVSESQPGFLASKFFNAALYGDNHPYGRTATGGSYEAATRDDAAGFVRTYLKPGGSILVLAGDLTLEEARSLTQRYLGAWEGRAAPPADAATRAARATEIILVNRPGSAQSNILVGNLTMRPGDSDYYAAVVANRILGGGGDARLFRILREQKAWTYGAYSDHNRPLGVGRFQVNTEVRTEVTDSALTELLHQVRLMQSQAVPDSELVAARGFLLGSFPLQIQTPQQVAGQVRNVKQLNLGDDYLTSYRAKLAAVGTDEILAVSGRLMKPDSSVIVVVGDGKAIHDGLAAIAPVRIIDAEGKALTPADLNPPTAPIAFDPARVVMRRDSFTILVQGQPFGGATFSFSASSLGGRPVIVAERNMSLPGFLSDHTTLTVDASSLASVSLKSTGTNQLGTLETDITYSADRVMGTTSILDPETRQIQSVGVDAAVGSHVMDSNVLSMFAGAMPLEDGASFSVEVFESSDNATGVRMVTVSDGGTITVPAGAFEVWHVTVNGGQLWEYQVAKSTGQIVRMEIIGQPLSFELVSSSGS